ncbi:unnamed protein product [Adineta ricciae]|uniref:Uncharacterized protein n=1 Tax=Adineta ricciae TaxID=249248 RepID=A0A814PT00_ADIRI|nr:unnamed protein product [Adineta ricciae]CAF1404621.1 unnamed protein product [Adineta ricciae]
MELWIGCMATKTIYFKRNITICQVERQTRVNLINYAVHDCTAVTEIYRATCPERKTKPAIANKQQHISIELRKTTQLNHCYQSDLSDVSDDEIELYLSQTKVKYQQTQTSRPQELAMELASESDFELETDPEQQRKRTCPSFVHRIIRPVYYRYDYRKIRA